MQERETGDPISMPKRLGEVVDGKLVSGPLLQPLASFDWSTFQLVIMDGIPAMPSGPERWLPRVPASWRLLSVELRTGPKRIDLHETTDIADLLCHLPSVKVRRANNRQLFLSAASDEVVQADILALLRALEDSLSSWNWFQTDLTDWPGFLGSSWDGDFGPGPELASLQLFDWEAYREVAESGQRSLEVDLPTGRITVPFDVYDDIAELLRALPSVDVWNDSGPDDNPASGSGFNFWLAEGFERTDVANQVSALLDALKRDLEDLQAQL